MNKGHFHLLFPRSYSQSIKAWRTLSFLPLIVEVVQQLRGQAGETQVSNATFGMAQNIGGSGSNVVTHILRREK